MGTLLGLMTQVSLAARAAPSSTLWVLRRLTTWPSQGGGAENELVDSDASVGFSLGAGTEAGAHVGEMLLVLSSRMISASVGKELNYTLVDFHSSRPGHDLR